MPSNCNKEPQSNALRRITERYPPRVTPAAVGCKRLLARAFRERDGLRETVR